MKRITLLLLLTLSVNFLSAQKKDEAQKLVDEGTAYHDKGDYNGAIDKYDKALVLDKDNLDALAEKAYTLCTMKKYDDAIENCKKAIEKHPGEDDLNVVYVTYGNSLDGLNNTDKAIEIYDEGIKLFPASYQLYFNKGISLSSVKKNDEAIICFEKAAMLKPTHAGSHNALGILMDIDDKRIPALLAYCRFLIVEPQGDRAEKNLASIQRMMGSNVEKTGKKSVNINIDPAMLADTAANGKTKENSFSSTDLLLTIDAALDYDKKYAKKTDVEKFIRKFEGMCASLSETKKDNFGFFWDYYVPYFLELKDKNLVETFSYIIFASSDKPEVAKWLKSHEDDIKKFYTWSRSFNWKTS